MIKRLTSLAPVKSTHAGSIYPKASGRITSFDQFQELAKRLARASAFLLCSTFILVQSAHAGDEPSPAVKAMCVQLWTTLLPQQPRKPEETQAKKDGAEIQQKKESAGGEATEPSPTEKIFPHILAGGEVTESKIDKRVVLKNETGDYILNFDQVAQDDKLSKEEFDKECLKARKAEPFKLGTLQFSRSFLTLYYFNKFIETAPFWLGLISVMLFAATRFKLTLPERERLSPPLSPRSFTTAFRYWIASFTYMGCFSNLYLAILLLGSIPGVHRRVLEYLAGPFTTEMATPIWAALLATAVIPAIPAIANLDTKLRNRLQEFASIPNKARAIADEVLASLKPREPAVINGKTPRDKVVAAINRHQQRLGELWKIKPKLEDLPDNQLSHRYSEFFSQNAEIEKALQTEVSSGLSVTRTDKPSACYIEDKYRSTVPKVARFLICAMLSAEATEPRVRDRLIDHLNFDIQRSVFRFNYGLLITVPAAIFIAVLISCLFAYALYDVRTGDAKWDGAFLVFLRWSVQTVFLYLPPITVAAAAAMYLLDKTATSADRRLPWHEYLVAVLLTLFATGMLCFFILLGLGIMLPTLLRDTDKVMTVSQVWPWAIPPTLVATTYMWLSTYGISATRRGAQAWRYGLILSAVATLGSFVAYKLFLLDSTREKLVQLMFPIPDGALGYLLSLSPALLGLVLGFVLSSTREPLPSQSVQETVKLISRSDPVARRHVYADVLAHDPEFERRLTKTVEKIVLWTVMNFRRRNDGKLVNLGKGDRKAIAAAEKTNTLGHDARHRL